MQKSKILITIIVLALIIGSVLYFTSKSLPKKEEPSTQSPIQPNALSKITSNQSATSTSALKSTSSASSKKAVKTIAPQPLIVAAALSTSISIDAANIHPLNPTTVFAPTAKDIFATLTLKNATQRTQLSYIRYYEGRYVESNVSHPTKIGANNFYFQWTLKAGQTRKTGKYKLVFYADGKKFQTVNYLIR